MLFKTSARAFFSTMLIYCSYFWLKLHITRAVLNCCTYLAPRGDMPKSAAERTGWEEALFCLLFSASTQHTGWISGLFLCYAADALFVCFLIFVLFASPFCSFRYFLLHGHVRPQRTSAGKKRTCWRSGISKDCTELQAVDREDPSLDPRNTQILH